MHSSLFRWLLIIGGSIALGFYLTQDGLITWDAPVRYNHSQWLLSQYGLLDHSDGSGNIYAPLWELILGIGTNIIFALFHDPYWVRHALTFSLFHISIVGLFFLLRRAGYSQATALLGISSLYGIIRLGGHSLFNVKDAPAALVFLLASVGLWLLLRKWSEQKNPLHWPLLVSMGAVSVAPLLFRFPLLLHLGLLTCFMAGFVLFEKRTIHLFTRLTAFSIPLITAGVLFFALNPSLWVSSVEVVAEKTTETVTSFSNFHRESLYVRVFGHTYLSGSLPWWYALAWIPVIVHSTTFIVACAGLYTWFTQQLSVFVLKQNYSKSKRALWNIEWSIGSFNFSLSRWLFLITAIAWVTVFVLQPTLYDEERQILFLFPPLFLWLVLQLDSWNKSIKTMLALLIIIWSTWTYSQWQEWSYIYKSPLTGHTQSNQFLGDYWQLCNSQAVKHIPKGSPVFIDGYLPITETQAKRIGLAQLQFIDEPPIDTTPFTVVSSNSIRTELFDIIHRYSRRDAESIIWQETLPSGDSICLVTHYNDSRPTELLRQRTIIDEETTIQ